VTKPWGWEVWLTDNLADPAYALKQISMTAGHRSSLQSHDRKAETNYVVTGTAVVLNGGTAPVDPSARVDPVLLPRSVHIPGSSWSSPPGMLHRVIAEQDYTAVEVSTPELDDVRRWQDDTGRASGRIEAEHGGRR
jgi:quercetin dioxygenase-like cupin family protein